MNKQDAFEMAVIELLGQEALLEEKISIYKTASMFWNAACDWQKAQDIKAVTNEYLVEPTTQADDLAYDQAIFDAINAIRKEDTSAR